MLTNGACWHQILSPQALTGCWKELLKQTWMECQLVHTHFGSGFCRWCHSTCQATWTSHLVPALETMASKTASLGLEMNCQKTKVQALDSRKDEPSTVTVYGRRLQWLKSLSILAPLYAQQLKALLISHVTMPLLVYDCAESRQSDLEVKVNNFHVNQVEALRVYNTCILPIFLYGSWAVTKRDLLKINDLNQCCLRKLLGIKWYHHVRNNEVRWTTRQPHYWLLSKNGVSPCSAILPETDATKISTASNGQLEEITGQPSYYMEEDLKSNNLSLNEATEVVQNRPLWRLLSKFG